MSDGPTVALRARVSSTALLGVTLRRAEDGDGPGLTALVAAAYDEYACGPLDPEVFDADLARPATSARERDRDWWVLVDDRGHVVGSVALGPLGRAADGRSARELHRLYLAPEIRGAGLATSLVEGIAAEARGSGAALLLAWSDTRLTDAHPRYLALGFALAGSSRELGDPAGTTELLFALDLDTTQPGPERTVRD